MICVDDRPYGTVAPTAADLDRSPFMSLGGTSAGLHVPASFTQVEYVAGSTNRLGAKPGSRKKVFGDG